MGDNNENDAQSSVTHLPASLWNIPDLPFGIICSFLDISTLMNLRLVCKKFNSYINKISLQAWERRAKYSIWSDAVYPILRPANPDKLFWRMSCVALQKQKTLWTQNAYPLVEIVKKEYKRRRGFPLSSLLLMHDGTAYVVAKGRDLFYNEIESEHSDICKKFAYRSRILDLTILDNKIYSCADNEHIKSWEINNGHLQMETCYNFGSWLSLDWPNCLSSHPGQNVFAVGSFYGCVNVFDSRSNDLVNWYKVREDRLRICTLAINSEYILSASYDDRRVSVYDRRARRFLDDIEISERVTCIKMQQDCVLIGDNVGKLHVSNPKNNFEVVNSYDIGHTCRITGVYLTYGSLITSSLNNVIISSPTDPPRHMYTLDIPNIRTMDYQNGTFALFTESDQLLIYQNIQ